MRGTAAPVEPWRNREIEAGRRLTSAAGSLDVLFVCTANRCRSPLAEALSRPMLLERGIDGRAAWCEPPIGGPLAGYERTAAELRDLRERLVELAWPAEAAE